MDKKMKNTCDVVNIKILSTSDLDREEILNVLSEEFNFLTRDEVAFEIEDVDYSISLKAIDEDNKIVGVLLFQRTDIFDLVKRMDKTNILNYDLKIFKNKSGIQGTAFVIDKKYRGTRLNVLFIRQALLIIRDYDYVISEVMERLKTHNYWKRMGFKEVGIFEYSGDTIYVYFYGKNL